MQIKIRLQILLFLLILTVLGAIIGWSGTKNIKKNKPIAWQVTSYMNGVVETTTEYGDSAAIRMSYKKAGAKWVEIWKEEE